MRKIVIFALAILFFAGCDSKVSEQNDVVAAIANITQNTQEIADSLGQIVGHVATEADKFVDTVAKTAENMSGNLSGSVDIIKNVAKEQIALAANASVNAIEQIDKAMQQNVTQSVQKTENTTVATKVSFEENGKKVFAKCIVCHGKQANLKALNNSQDISKWSAESISSSLKGYKDGTYGGKFKASMAPIVKPLSESDMVDVAKYITTLN